MIILLELFGLCIALSGYVCFGMKYQAQGHPEASYTWEDNSLKFLLFNLTKMANLILAKLDKITISTVGHPIRKYVDRSKPIQFQWLTQPIYIGCAKLYRTLICLTIKVMPSTLIYSLLVKCMELKEARLRQLFCELQVL